MALKNSGPALLFSSHLFPTEMQITLNGQAHPIEAEITLTQLLESLNLGAKPVVAELNGQAILPRDFPTTPMRANDRIEVVALAAGG